MKSVIFWQDSCSVGEASGEMTKMTAIMGEKLSRPVILSSMKKIKSSKPDREEGVKKVEKFFHIENLADPGESGDPAQYNPLHCVPIT